MTQIDVIVTGPEEAYGNEAELWCARDRLKEAEQRLASY